MMSPPPGSGVKFDFPERCAAEALIEMGPETKALVPPEMLRQVEEAQATARDLNPFGEVDETKPKPRPKPEPKPTDW